MATIAQEEQSIDTDMGIISHKKINETYGHLTAKTANGKITLEYTIADLFRIHEQAKLMTVTKYYSMLPIETALKENRNVAESVARAIITVASRNNGAWVATDIPWVKEALAKEQQNLPARLRASMP